MEAAAKPATSPDTLYFQPRIVDGIRASAPNARNAAPSRIAMQRML